MNWEKLMRYKLPYFEAVKPMTKANMEQSGCTCIQGHGSLKDAHTGLTGGQTPCEGAATSMLMPTSTTS
ncbi:MAG: hypothetical protein IJS20_07120 [Bacteroidales bacterium]|nr:hypothetical protein [Bacteroidales bacterium]